MFKVILMFIATAFLVGCVTSSPDPICSLDQEQIETFKPRAYTFMESKGYQTKCEMLTSRIAFVPDLGCGVYGNATNGGINPRTGVDCPNYLDGGYYVIYDPQTLQPTEVVLIAW